MGCGLSHKRAGGRLLKTLWATAKQLHHLHSLTVPRGCWPHEAASWSSLSANISLLMYSSITLAAGKGEGLGHGWNPRRGSFPLLTESVVSSIAITTDLAISVLVL